MKRRTFFQGAAALAVSPWLSSCAEEDESVAGNRLERIGIQLYTVRNQMAGDVPGTLQKLAEIGYDEVEFAGYFDHTPAEIKAIPSGARSPAVPASTCQVRCSSANPVRTSVIITCPQGDNR